MLVKWSPWAGPVGTIGKLLRHATCIERVFLPMLFLRRSLAAKLARWKIAAIILTATLSGTTSNALSEAAETVQLPPLVQGLTNPESAVVTAEGQVYVT